MILKAFCLFMLTCSTIIAAPQAVIFDFGGVMTNKNPKKEAVIYFLREFFQLSESEYEQVNLRKKEFMKSGKTDTEFWFYFAKERNVILPENWENSFKAVLKDAIQLNPEMFALVEELKGNPIPIGLLSNIDQRLSKLIREFGMYQLFNPCILSCEIGFEKPDPRAYETVLVALQLPAGEIVFIDDKLDNVEAAKKLGFDAILFESPEQLREELKQRDLLQ